MFELTKRDVEIFLEFQRAARTRIFPGIRLISITTQAEAPDIFFFYDGPISEDDLESLNLMDTYSRTSGLEGITDGGWHFIRVDYPTPILHVPGECVYARKETPSLLLPKKKGGGIEKWMDRRTKICISIRRAMLDNIFPQIRMIGVAYTESTAVVHVITDGVISTDDHQSLVLMKNYFALQFPANEMINCDLVVVRVDMPQRAEEPFDVLVYQRKEEPNYRS